MESSSENFAWSDASSDSEHSDLMSVTRNSGMKSNQLDSPESEKNYKKKLHKKLFTKDVDSIEAIVKQELLDESRVKQEAFSEVEVKHKKKRNRESSSLHTHHKNLSLQIKLEQNSTEQLSKSSLTSGDELYNLHSTNHKKEKKKLKKKYSEDAQDINIITETTVLPQERRQNTEPESEQNSQNDINMQSKKRKKKKLKSENMDISDNKTSEESVSHDPINDIGNGTLLAEDNSHKESLPKIADTIQFEKDIDVISNDTNINNHSVQSSRLRRFIKTNIHLHLISSKTNYESIISPDDEIWLITCPSEVDVMSFKDKDLSLENKSKIKVDGQSYVANIDSSISRSTLMTFVHAKPLLKNILHGALHLHKRLPRTHVVEDNQMVNQQTDFIPLPETKHRHPLFGVDYKKAMKIPSTIKARLKESEIGRQPLPTDKKKTKKPKIRYNHISEITDTPEKSSHKRAHDQDLTPPKHKRTKRDLGADSWDSEKAIEQNLFNF